MKKLILLFSIVVLFLSCNTTDPPIKDDGEINLNLIDVSVAEAYLFISLENNSTKSISVFQNNETILNFSIAENDTVILINNLNELTEYKFKAALKNGTTTVDVSDEIRITTLAPTNNNFTWQVFTYGNPSYGSSVLRDVSIIDENNIWVVGEVYQLDSLGQTDTQVYGAGHWNGSEWNLMKVPLRDYGNPRPAPTPFNLKTVFTTENEIYAATSAHIIKFENDKWVEKYFLMEDLNFNGQVIQMYAYSEDNIYCVGRNGSIYNITSSGWNKLESGTETYLSDIWGIIDPVNGEENKFITGLHLGPNDETKLLKMNGQNIVEDLDWDQNSDLSSVWSNNGIPIFAAGNELLTNKTGDWEKIPEILFQYYVTCVRGTALNDIFVCGTLGLMAHYNGVEWLIFNHIAPGAIFGSIDIKGNTVCIVGEVGLDAIIVIGKRTN